MGSHRLGALGGAVVLWALLGAAGMDASGSEVKARPAWLPEGCTGCELLYENTFAGPKDQREAQAAKDWAMEGGGIAEWADGHLRLKAKRYTEKRSNVETDHFVYWLKRDFPADIAVEWDFRFPDWKESPNGLAIIFVCAKGVRGEDIFDPGLAKREGVFVRYHSGDINSYHISYFAGKRGKANVRKNSGFKLVASGDDLVAAGGPEKWHRLLLTRFGATIELRVDGKPCLRWTDDGTTHGPTHGGGKLGLRQQNDLLWADYTNLRVYGLQR
ncbi:MAG: DUF1961 family protein [Planctomycetes bacterium]|nr:DUF1961 family protein [Planctomycetota bacterium]